MNNWDARRWDGQSGHYESWFQRANHPTRPLAFWIRHTIFCPKGAPDQAEGELWSMWFDGETGKTVAAKSEMPIKLCQFGGKGLDIRLPGAHLEPGSLQGQTPRMRWHLRWTGGGAPSLLLPESLYSGAFPKAKALCISPNAQFAGSVEVDGQIHDVTGWHGSHNHNWGSQHTDRYAWGQVCGFDGAPDVFLECATAQIKLGPLMTPKVTVVALNVGPKRYEINSIGRGLMASAQIDGFQWRFKSKGRSAQGDFEIEAQFAAPAAHFAGLRYRNPPGGAKACLNSKIAQCKVTLKQTGVTQTFSTQNRAAFEILCELDDPRVAQVGGLTV